MQLALGGIGSHPDMYLEEGLMEYEARTVNPILCFLAIFPMYASLISDVWVV